MPNEMVKFIVDKYPDRFLWFCNVDPREGKNRADSDLGYLLEFYKSIGALGVGEITANIYADDPRLDNLFSFCEELDMPVTIHIAPEERGYYGIIDELGLPRIEKMLKKHPKLKVFGHSQCFWSEIGEPVQVDRFVEEGEVLQFGEAVLEVIELPGHSAGSVGFYEREMDVLFTGDALMHTGFFGGLAQYCDYDLYCQSMQKLADLNPGTVYTAHTEPYYHGAAAKAAVEAIAFAGKILADVEEYLQIHGNRIRIGEAAKYVCDKEGKKWGCGACVCVLNHLKRMQNPEVEKQVDFTKYLYGM
jgi:glyoxylase-like metal-dependent hydrolase (beta-lactamase superfamily II)